MPEFDSESEQCFSSTAIQKQNAEQYNIGGLLYPSFNTIVSTFFETILPNIKGIGNNEGSVLIQTFYQLIGFAFRTQILEKRMADIVRPVYDSNAYEPVKKGAYEPILLDF